jgi:hypothetical protein
MEKELLALIEELVCQQRDKLLALARSILPGMTVDDILQPNDFPELEENPHFRFEEGILNGLLAAQAALQTEIKKIS